MNIILLSGGSGKRLWPLSNDVRSKQFIKILSVPHVSSADSASSVASFADSSFDSSSVNSGTHCIYDKSDKSIKSITHSADSSVDSSTDSNTVGTEARSEAEAAPLESMVQRVYRQIRQADPTATITIATSKSQVSALHNQLGQDINNINLSVEPCRRDTFAAIALAVSYLHFVKNVDRDEAVVVCPVDPYVEDEYFRVVKEMYERAKKGKGREKASICLMGIKPTYPSEKYGYIKPVKVSSQNTLDAKTDVKTAASIAADIMVTPSMSDTRDITDIPDDCAVQAVQAVQAATTTPCGYKHRGDSDDNSNDNDDPSTISWTFTEKPTKEKAAEYIAQGALWNGGVFAFKLSYVLDKAEELLGTSDYDTLLSGYAGLKKISFDYAVVEQEQNIAVVQYSGIWKDLGTWNTLTEAMEETALGPATIADSCKSVHVINELGVPILALGLNNVIISASPEGILVSDKEQSSYIKPFVDQIDSRVMFAEKSWGSYRVIDVEPESLTVLVTLNQGHRMNYHSHLHRDEVWTVIKGSGITIVDDMEQPVHVGDVITMAAGCKHTVIAGEAGVLQLIEVQLGSEINVSDKEKFPMPTVTKVTAIAASLSS